MITEDYVNFETAKLLKEKGFDEHCIGFYTPEKELHFTFLGETNSTWLDESISAPTLQMAMKWLREKKHLQLCVYCCSEEWFKHGWSFLVKRLKYDEVLGWNEDNSISAITDKRMSDDLYYRTYEEVCAAGIKHVLENLI